MTIGKMSVKGMLWVLTLVAVIATAGLVGCAGMYEMSEGEHGPRGEGGGEHSREGSGRGESGGEESGNLLALDESYDTVRRGTRLIMSYQAADNAFLGTVENVTEGPLTQVRVEVHLANGVELGPTTPVDLAPGQVAEVRLAAPDQGFDGWTPHAEVGPAVGGEHGSGGEGKGEHGAEDASKGTDEGHSEGSGG